MWVLPQATAKVLRRVDVAKDATLPDWANADIKRIPPTEATMGILA